MSWVQGELSIGQASSLWTFGRATPMDGDKLAWTRYYDRMMRPYLEAGLALTSKVSNNLVMNNNDTFESLLLRMSELTWMPLDAREKFDEMLRVNFDGNIND
ncbi:hypothetical protein PBI_BALSA_55 [Microbacterium phage Balsa]|uniref:Uncharacterized protein n=3 Tax=Ilzatvirus TaxID=2560150 RepID=A0A2L0HND8_9CAUD|nr:hypothetical protein PBI_PEPPINO_56 [Microbacterium phage Peppino]AUX83581.1 hypothetical protein PBI_BALSA_55 [Microbacterium phage Balsa]